MTSTRRILGALMLYLAIEIVNYKQLAIQGFNINSYLVVVQLGTMYMLTLQGQKSLYNYGLLLVYFALSYRLYLPLVSVVGEEWVAKLDDHHIVAKFTYLALVVMLKVLTAEDEDEELADYDVPITNGPLIDLTPYKKKKGKGRHKKTSSRARGRSTEQRTPPVMQTAERSPPSSSKLDDVRRKQREAMQRRAEARINALKKS